jgi:hypothetical protein
MINEEEKCIDLETEMQEIVARKYILSVLLFCFFLFLFLSPKVRYLRVLQTRVYPVL